MLDVRRMRLLWEFKQRGTLAAVAAALSYSPSAVSQQLAQLEAEVGVPLLEPVGRRVRLTEHGEILVAHAGRVLELLERAEAELAAAGSVVAGTVRVAAFQTAALALVPAALTYLARRHPALRVEVVAMEPERSLPAVVARELDVALGEEFPGHPRPRRRELERRVLGVEPLELAVPAGWSGSVPGDFAGRPWAMEPVGTAAREWATAVCREAGFEPDVRYVTTDLVIHSRLVASGHAVALLPRLAARPGGGARVLALPGRPERRVFTAVRRGAGGRPAIAAFHRGLRRAVADQLRPDGNAK